MKTFPLIKFEGVSKKYDTGTTSRCALRDVDLNIDTGEFVAITGASQSGKSTCMHILGGMEIPTSGTYRLDGLHMETLSPERRHFMQRKYLGVVCQGNNLFYPVSALENIELPLLYCALSATKRRMLALEALEEVGLSQWTTHRPDELSRKQLRELVIARALVTHPRILLTDEPTENLDTEESLEIMGLLKQIYHTKDITLILATQKLDIARYARRHIYCDQGCMKG